MDPRLSEMTAAEYATMAKVEDDHWWYRTLRRLVLASLAEHGLSAEARLLDAGCGTGSGLSAWSRTVAAVGLDVSSEALVRCVRRGVGPLAQGSIEALPFLSGSFDAVVTLDVICLAGIDPSRALSDIYRVLRPGGVLVLNVPAFEQLRGQHDAAVHVGHRFRREELDELLYASGFVQTRVRYWNAFLCPLVWLVRKLRRKGAGESASSDLARLPLPVNALLLALLRLETSVLRRRSPFGTSVFAVAERPAP